MDPDDLDTEFLLQSILLDGARSRPGSVSEAMSPLYGGTNDQPPQSGTMLNSSHSMTAPDVQYDPPSTHASALTSDRKRPRENSRASVWNETKSRRIDSEAVGSPQSLTNSDHDLLESFGLAGDEDLLTLARDQRVTEQWLEERREQERKDEEFARALQESWDEIEPPTQPYSVTGQATQQPYTMATGLMPPPAQSAASSSTTMHRSNNRIPNVRASFSNPGKQYQPPPQNIIEISSDSEVDELHSKAKVNNFPKQQVTPHHAQNSSESKYQMSNIQLRGGAQFPQAPMTTYTAQFGQPHQPTNMSDSYGAMQMGPAFPFLPPSSDSKAWYSFANPPTPYGTQLPPGSFPVNNGYGTNPLPYSPSIPRMPAFAQLEARLQKTEPNSLSGQSMCPPDCTCNDSIMARVNNLRNLYRDNDGLEAQDMKQELKRLLENIRPDQDMGSREGTPDAMKFNLMEHQKLGLAWMKSMEEGSNKGGILADDMGLGKTVQAIALMVSRPSTNQTYKTNLIVAPVALLHQWKREIARMLKPENQLSVYILHGEKRRKFAELCQYDVVLTTYGTLASEFKRKEQWRKFTQENPNLDTSSLDCNLPTLGEGSRWYRVILDEAQCIKNRHTKSALAAYDIKSEYRWCMSGTPMMNSVQELHSLICFLRIGPYNKIEAFNAAFTRQLKITNDDVVQERAMQRLQALLKAILLRRTKTSEIDGKPILQLPPRVTEKVHAVFNKDELEFYTALETKSQLQFNKYMRAGTVGRNYSNILVLLLRLRQACCHPHLIHDFAMDPAQAAVTEEVDPIENAKRFDEIVVSRLKNNEASECPVCIDAMENAVIFFPCGHSTCSECFAKISHPDQAIARGNDGSSEFKCPNCRGKVDPKKVTDNVSFQKVHVLGETEEPTEKETDETNESSDSDDSEDDDDDLKDFIVPDGEVDNDGSPATEPKRAKRDKKGKGKAVKKQKKTLAELKKEAMGSAKGRRKYFKKLMRNWEPSAKVEKTVEILQSIIEEDSEEKTIIFSQFTSLLDLLEIPIMRRGWNYKRYDGSMKPADRNNAVMEFTDDPHCKIMLVSLKAGNSGLNLVAASQVILLDPFWNPYLEDQAIDRAHRIGQIRPVKVHRLLIKATVEDRILDLQERKRALIEGALDEKASKSVGRLQVRELAYLFDVAVN
ncbi:hypothetical protein FQN57_006656 [Myotisia sp. PD_48]|nr:hypothetical protein FQN57_006656 [Myotisia sp. PD_48]